MTKLFTEFDAVSAKAWKQKIQVDLKGADYNDALVWTSPEGISVKPFYSEDDLDIKAVSNTKTSNWKIAQQIYVTSEESANLKALETLSKGAEAISFIIPSEKIDVDLLLKDLNATSVFLNFTFLSDNLVNSLSQLKHKNTYLNIDILGHLCREGNWFNHLKKDHEILDHLLEATSRCETQISVDVSLYQNAGAHMVQQLAYAMAHTNEYFDCFGGKIASKICYKVAVGSNYFFEIAKLRALRQLHGVLAKAYNVNPDCFIYAKPSKRNKTIYDYNTNMLRTTSECMSAILGGANFVYNLPYDTVYHKENDFGERISRNQLLVLKHESYFNTVNNPAEGAFYIESLTSDLAQNALDLFKHIEANGGFLSQLKEGTIQRKIKESAAEEQEKFDNNEEILLGTNKHPNPNDRMKNELDLYPFVKTNKRKTLIEPIIPKRLAEATEKERLKKEENE